MAAFLTPLQVERLDDISADGRGTWKLLGPLVFLSDIAGQIAVPAGFVTDFASVPRLPLAFMLAGDTAHKAAVVHDWLYTTHQVDRATADQVFHEASIAMGVPGWRAWIMKLAVRVGGGGSWDAPGPVQPPEVTTLAN